MLTPEDIKALNTFRASGSVSAVPPLFWQRVDAYLNVHNVPHMKIPSTCTPCLVSAANAAWSLWEGEHGAAKSTPAVTTPAVTTPAVRSVKSVKSKK